MRTWPSIILLIFGAAGLVRAEAVEKDELRRIDHGIVRDAGSGLIYSHPDNIYTQGSTVVYDEARDIINQDRTRSCPSSKTACSVFSL